MRSALVAVIVIMSIGVFAPPTVDARGEKRVDIHTFMTGLACIESGGRFGAVNDRSGAIGKYQVMPRNWVAWAHRYLGNRWALPTPRNQEFVARQRIIELYERHGSWRRVAYWWLTGNGEADESRWSAKAFGYVNNVMGVAIRAATPTFAATVPDRCFPKQFSDPTIRTEPFPRVWVRGGAVNVRLAAGYENRAVAVVRRGFRLAVLGRGVDARGEPWLRVGLSDGRTGWVARWFTEPIGR